MTDVGFRSYFGAVAASALSARVTCCSQSTHDAIKATAAVWESLPLMGEQDDGDGGLIEVRMCDECGERLSIALTDDSDYGAESYVESANDGHASDRWAA